MADFPGNSPVCLLHCEVSPWPQGTVGIWASLITGGTGLLSRVTEEPPFFFSVAAEQTRCNGPASYTPAQAMFLNSGTWKDPS